MTANDIFTIVAGLILVIMGTYYNYKFNQIGKEDTKKNR